MEPAVLGELKHISRAVRVVFDLGIEPDSVGDGDEELDSKPVTTMACDDNRDGGNDHVTDPAAASPAPQGVAYCVC